MLHCPDFAASPRLAHAFFTRQGGVSAGVYAALNCGPGSADDPAHVARNRALAMDRLGLPASALCTLYQVHGRDVVSLSAPFAPGERPKADGLVTATPGIALGVLAADCAPVLFADIEGGVIGACHAGWKGALAGVTDATVAAMQAMGARAERITACIGPAIAQSSYEVGPEFPGPFLAADPDSVRFFAQSSRTGHFLFNLPAYLAKRLNGLGLGHVVDLARDTLGDPERFFSYRRATLAGEKDYGRQLSAIALRP
jgi:YfiH family protein